MFGKIKCFLGWHRFTWKFEGKPISLYSSPPDYATCKRCGCFYKVDKDK